MRRAEINTEWRTVAAEPLHWEYRIPIDESAYINPTVGTPIPAEIPDVRYYYIEDNDIDRGGTSIRIANHRFLFTHDVGRYFSMDWDIYADAMVYRWLENFAPDPKRMIHYWAPTPINPFLIYEKRCESIWDMGQVEHILKCYSDPGVFRMGDCVILSTKQYDELEKLNAILPRYKYMTNDTVGSNDVDELIAAIKKKSKKEMGYFV